MQTMANVNETGWYKIHFKPNTPAVIVLRILSSLRLEPQSVLKVLHLPSDCLLSKIYCKLVFVLLVLKIFLLETKALFSILDMFHPRLSQ